MYIRYIQEYTCSYNSLEYPKETGKQNMFMNHHEPS